MNHETIVIEGMSCGGCVNSVRKALERLEVNVVEVTIGTATVEYDPAATSRETLVEAIVDAGFDVPAVE